MRVNAEPCAISETLSAALQVKRPYHLGDARYSQDLDSLKRAAVLVLFNEKCELLVILRSQGEGIHAGQPALPGGLIESYDCDPVQTALRETAEEVGLSGADIVVIGQLPPLPTFATGYLVTPIVGVLRSQKQVQDLKLNRREVERAEWIPWSQFVAEGEGVTEAIEVRGRKIQSRVFNLGGMKIWGMTAVLLGNLVTRWKTAIWDVRFKLPPT